MNLARRPIALLLAMMAFAVACSSADGFGDDARGMGLAEAALPLEKQVEVYAVAVRAAFDVGPDLTLLADSILLPRWSGYDGGSAMPATLLQALRQTRLVRGVCAADRGNDRSAPRCAAGQAGYIARFSPIFQRGGDTLQLYLLSEIFATSDGPGQQPFSFEMAYQVVPRGSGWRVVQEGRVRQSGSAQ
ncbi:MAG: hypothetical protein ABIZ91_13775 [Gemmatimonadaceae bacterium]